LSGKLHYRNTTDFVAADARPAWPERAIGHAGVSILHEFICR
jgi:hypothetical protein